VVKLKKKSIKMCHVLVSCLNLIPQSPNPSFQSQLQPPMLSTNTKNQHSHSFILNQNFKGNLGIKIYYIVQVPNDLEHRKQKPNSSRKRNLWCYFAVSHCIFYDKFIQPYFNQQTMILPMILLWFPHHQLDIIR